MSLIDNKNGEMNFFDSSLSSITDNIDNVLSEDEYVNFLFDSFKKINEHIFNGNAIKQRVRKHADRITGSCPYCGDSVKSDWKQRGNIILKGKFKHYYKCFNCNKFIRVDNFLRDFKINVDLNSINYIANNITDFSTSVNAKYDLSIFLDIESIDKYAIDREEFKKYFNLLEAKDSSIWKWLKDRMQYDASKFLYNLRLNHLIILNLTHTGKILGIQKRTFKGYNKYLTYHLQKIYELMKRNPKEIPGEISMLSQLFNICLVDYSKPIILCEGPLDSFLIKNCISNAGANKSFPFDIPVKYFYDSDEVGIRKSIEKINNGETIFLWNKFLKTINAPYRKKWDINDIFIWSKKNHIKLPSFDLFFSNDYFDIIDL